LKAAGPATGRKRTPNVWKLVKECRKVCPVGVGWGDLRQLRGNSRKKARRGKAECLKISQKKKRG